MLDDFLNRGEKFVANWLKADESVQAKSVCEKLKNMDEYRSLGLPAVAVKCNEFEKSDLGVVIKGFCEVVTVGDYEYADNECSLIISQIYNSLTHNEIPSVQNGDFWDCLSDIKVNAGGQMSNENKGQYVFVGNVKFGLTIVELS